MPNQAVRDELRGGRSRSLRRRRWIALLSGIGAADFIVISLYQLGVIRHLPDPPGAIFDSDRVNASSTAYPFGVPDGTLGLGLYALTMALAGVGGSKATGRHAAFDLALGGAAAAGAVGAAHYLYDMIRNQRRACPYCLVGTAVNFTSAALAAPLVLQSVRELRGRASRR